MIDLFDTLLTRYSSTDLTYAKVIPWSSPVPVFGSLETSRVATLGLNPSNREFVDVDGQELEGPYRRFETLSSLNLSRWSDATAMHIGKVWRACQTYFSLNPYDAWFRRLDSLISGTAASYYHGTASHLDMVPYATSCKWAALTTDQRKALFTAAGDCVLESIRRSPIRVLILNGASVVSYFQYLFGINLERRPMSGWSLRSGSTFVPGFAYTGQISKLANTMLDRPILVLGFNHNIQRSFGVTTEVISSIRKWIGRTSGSLLDKA